MEKLAPNGHKWGPKVFFLLTQTLSTLWAERILILGIFRFGIFADSQISLSTILAEPTVADRHIIFAWLGMDNLTKSGISSCSSKGAKRLAATVPFFSRRVVFAYEGNVRPPRCESVPGADFVFVHWTRSTV